ncbi:LAMI_0D01200g1_1 [Lachancea mirantina]|uniref:LAMI_0D01200g1_1 n=1 Tax=Lachancea mirantina TaxID=1230905 RepID=A0A1G4J8H4_9SACH|nr:LAMI_0D01200g1_1 [Lachancea mirantina]
MTSKSTHRVRWFPKPGNYFFIVPWIAFIPWYGMLVAMLVCWAAQGHPIYWFMHTDQFPVYISDIGATNLRPLFISCAGWQGLGYCITVACEYFQRAGRWPFQRGLFAKTTSADHGSATASTETIKSNYRDVLLSAKFLMPPYYTRHERNCIFAAFVLGLVGEVCLLMCSIFSTAKFPHVHTSMVALFCVFMFLSTCCLMAEYYMMGKHYAALHPLASLEERQGVKTSRHKWVGHSMNKFTLSAIAKTLWLTLALVWAICFGAIDDNSISGCFEWLLAFWFGVLFMIISVDFYLGGRYKYSKYFHQVTDFQGYYKYERLVPSVLQEPV